MFLNNKTRVQTHVPIGVTSIL